MLVTRARTFCRTNAARVTRLSCKRYLCLFALRPRITFMLKHKTSCKFINVIRIATRSFTSVNYDNPSPQLIEENPSLNYKLYYQYGLPTAADRAELDKFNDFIWYGREGHEVVVRTLEMSRDFKTCDIFIMRDYHNNKIIAFNSIKRVYSTTDKIFNTDKYGNDPFNYTIRRNTAVAPELQGKGYGKVIRKYSKELDDLHCGNRGVSITTVQVKNVASRTLQLKSGFEIIGNANIYLFHRSKLVIPDNIAAKYHMYKVDPIATETEWKIVNGLHHEMIKKHGIIDMSTTSNEIYHDPDTYLPVYVIKGKSTNQILAVIQGKYLSIRSVLTF